MNLSAKPVLLPFTTIFIAGLPFIDVANGLVQSGSADSLLATSYKAMVIPILIGTLALRGTSRRALQIALIIWLMLFLQIAIPSLLFGNRFNTVDLVVVARGPVLFSLFWLLLKSVSQTHVPRIANTYFKITWWIITSSILLMQSLGVSLATYEGTENYGAKGAYVAANEVTIIYMMSWWYITRGVVSTKINAAIYTLLTLFMLLVIGTKSGFLVFAIATLWRSVVKFISPSRAFFVFTIAAAIAISFAADLFLAIGPFLKGWDRLSFFAEQYSPETALTGGRFLQLPEVISTFTDFGPLQIIFGLGYKKFWGDIDDNSIESDILDLYGGGGLVSIVVFYGFLVSSLLFSLRKRALAQWGGIITAVVLYSIFVGHIAFAATPIISLAILLSVMSFENHHENRHRPIVVPQPQGSQQR